MVRKLFNKILGCFSKKSYALNELDLKLLPYLDYRGGFFVEAGANDGIHQSNTLYYEKYKGWTGLLIEAIPALSEECRQNRPKCIVENCALVSSQFSGKSIELEYYNLMSLVKGSFDDEVDENVHKDAANRILHENGNDTTYSVVVPARTLTDVLTNHDVRQIDLLSLDVEGYEANVLSGINFNLHAPKFILVETRHKKKSEIETILLPHYDQVAILNSNTRFADILFHYREL
jgi:FkbM family methyltransferase